MPSTQNPKEVGWFYHAPAKKNADAVPVEYPAPSQIPGIGYHDPSLFDKEEVKEVMFKETDSKYIRLAKVGGRKDLLQFNPDRFGKKSEEAVGYNRNEWFYLEDNRMEDQEKKDEEHKEWDFLLPEYMVHKGYKPSFEDPENPPSRGSRAPFHTESLKEGEREDREGRSATNKTVKIPEIRKPGYGVRNAKPPAPTKPLPRDNVDVRQKRREKILNAHVQLEKNDPTNMMKLLSGGYTDKK